MLHQDPVMRFTPKEILSKMELVPYKGVDFTIKNHEVL